MCGRPITAWLKTDCMNGAANQFRYALWDAMPCRRGQVGREFGGSGSSPRRPNFFPFLYSSQKENVLRLPPLRGRGVAS